MLSLINLYSVLYLEQHSHHAGLPAFAGARRDGCASRKGDYNEPVLCHNLNFSYPCSPCLLLMASRYLTSFPERLPGPDSFRRLPVLAGTGVLGPEGGPQR